MQPSPSKREESKMLSRPGGELSEKKNPRNRSRSRQRQKGRKERAQSVTSRHNVRRNSSRSLKRDTLRKSLSATTTATKNLNKYANLSEKVDMLLERSQSESMLNTTTSGTATRTLSSPDLLKSTSVTITALSHSFPQQKTNVTSHTTNRRSSLGSQHYPRLSERANLLKTKGKLQRSRSESILFRTASKQDPQRPKTKNLCDKLDQLTAKMERKDGVVVVGDGHENQKEEEFTTSAKRRLRSASLSHRQDAKGEQQQQQVSERRRSNVASTSSTTNRRSSLSSQNYPRSSQRADLLKTRGQLQRSHSESILFQTASKPDPQRPKRTNLCDKLNQPKSEIEEKDCVWVVGDGHETQKEEEISANVRKTRLRSASLSHRQDAKREQQQQQSSPRRRKNPSLRTPYPLKDTRRQTTRTMSGGASRRTKEESTADKNYRSRSSQRPERRPCSPSPRKKGVSKDKPSESSTAPNNFNKKRPGALSKSDHVVGSAMTSQKINPPNALSKTDHVPSTLQRNASTSTNALLSNSDHITSTRRVTRRRAPAFLPSPSLYPTRSKIHLDCSNALALDPPVFTHNDPSDSETGGNDDSEDDTTMILKEKQKATEILSRLKKIKIETKRNNLPAEEEDDESSSKSDAGNRRTVFKASSKLMGGSFRGLVTRNPILATTPKVTNKHNSGSKETTPCSSKPTKKEKGVDKLVHAFQSSWNSFPTFEDLKSVTPKVNVDYDMSYSKIPNLDLNDSGALMFEEE